MSKAEAVLNEPTTINTEQVQRMLGIDRGLAAVGSASITANEGKATKGQVLEAAFVVASSYYGSRGKGEKEAAVDVDAVKAARDLIAEERFDDPSAVDILQKAKPELAKAAKSVGQFSDDDAQRGDGSDSELFEHAQFVYSKQVPVIKTLLVRSDLAEPVPPGGSPSIFVTPAKYDEYFRPTPYQGTADESSHYAIISKLISDVITLNTTDEEGSLSAENNAMLKELTGHDQDEIWKIAKEGVEEHRRQYRDRGDMYFVAAHIAEKGGNFIDDLCTAIDPKGRKFP